MRLYLLIFLIFFCLCFFETVSSSDKPSLLFDRIYVINLKRRNDRKEKMKEQLAKIEEVVPHTFVEAIDGSILTKKWMKENNYRAYPAWRDPFYGRVMTRGEIGCAISHTKAWEMIVRDGKPGLILEDDIILYQEFVDENVKYKQDLGNVAFDLLYLWRMPLKKEAEKVDVKTLFIKPKYSYSCSAYIVTPKGAKMLLETHFKQNLIPVDEYVPMMYGESPLIDAHLFSDYKKLDALSLKNQSALKQIEFEGLSDTENINNEYNARKESEEELVEIESISEIPQSGGVYFTAISHTNFKDDRRMKFFNRSSKYYGFSTNLITGGGEREEDVSKIRSILAKMKEYKEKYDSIQQTKKSLFVCIILDAENKVIASSPYMLWKGFNKYYSHDKLLFSQSDKQENNTKGSSIEDSSSESYDATGEVDDLDDLMEMVATESKQNKKQTKIESDLFFSSYENIYRLLSEFLSQNKHSSFSTFIEESYLSNPSIQLDTNNEVFQNINAESQLKDLYFEYNYGFVQSKKGIAAKIFEIELSSRTLGLQISSFVGAWNFLKNSHPPDINETSLSSEEMKTSPEIFPSILFYLPVNNNMRKLKQMLDGIKNLKYPSSKLHFLIETDERTLSLSSSSLLNDLKSFMETNKITYRVVSPQKSVVLSRRESIKVAKSEKFSFYFTTSSILRDPFVLIKLVNKNKEMISPQLYEASSNNGNFFTNYTLDSKQNVISEYCPTFFLDRTIEPMVYSRGTWEIPIIFNTFLLKGDVFEFVLENLEKEDKVSLTKLDQVDAKISHYLFDSHIYPVIITERKKDHFGELLTN